jgi:hypothetical protein
MNDTVVARVVEIEAMGRNSVAEGGTTGGQIFPGPYDRSGARRVLFQGDFLCCGGDRCLRTSDTDTDNVYNTPFCSSQDGVRDIIRCEGGSP